MLRVLELSFAVVYETKILKSVDQTCCLRDPTMDADFGTLIFTYGCLYSPYWWHLFSSETPFLAYNKYFIMLSEHHTCMVLANQKLRFWKHLIKDFIFLIVILTRCVIKQLSLSISQTAWPPGCPNQLSLRSRVKTLVLDCQNTCHILRSSISQVPNTWVLWLI